MQNRYVGDVGDFGKLGLLRILCGQDAAPLLRLGVVWYLYPDEARNADGKHLGYLRKNIHFSECDESLYQGLRALFLDETGNIVLANRLITTLETSDFLPARTVFYNKPLAYSNGELIETRKARRKTWLEGALRATEGSDIVFLDPDNGIECKSVSQTSSKGPKYVYWSDIAAFIGRKQSLIIYHHLNRTEKHSLQVEGILKEIRQRFPGYGEAFAMTFVRGTSRTYFVVAAPCHKELLQERLTRMNTGFWSQHFVLHENNAAI